jgi:hypothetical protein
MKKLVNMSVLFGVIALVMLLAVGSAAAFEIEPEIEPGDLGEGEVEAEPEAEAPAEAGPEGTAARIDFEIAGHAAKKGHYSIQALGGGEIASWYALDGWEDSGWISNIDIGNRTVWVEVVYYPGPETEGTVMTILNHVPDEAYGWVASGQAHALEVAWPDQELMAEAEPNP